MNLKRYRELMDNEDLDLTEDERKDGYFFCCDWDGLLIKQDSKEAECCSCMNAERRANQ